MTTRNRALTAQIKPDTRNAIMDQLAAAADALIVLRIELELWQEDWKDGWCAGYQSAMKRRWWHRFVPARWRA